MIDLVEWEFKFTYGYDLKVYGKGNDRIAIDKDGNEILHYKLKRSDNDGDNHLPALRETE